MTSDIISLCQLIAQLLVITGVAVNHIDRRSLSPRGDANAGRSWRRWLSLEPANRNSRRAAVVLQPFRPTPGAPISTGEISPAESARLHVCRISSTSSRIPSGPSRIAATGSVETGLSLRSVVTAMRGKGRTAGFVTLTGPRPVRLSTGRFSERTPSPPSSRRWDSPISPCRTSNPVPCLGAA